MSSYAACHHGPPLTDAFPLPRNMRSPQLFRTPSLNSAFLQMLHSFVANFSRLNPALFALAGGLGQAAFFIDIPSEILARWGERRPRNPWKGGQERGSKTDLEKDTKK